VDASSQIDTLVDEVFRIAQGITNKNSISKFSRELLFSLIACYDGLSKKELHSGTLRILKDEHLMFDAAILVDLIATGASKIKLNLGVKKCGSSFTGQPKNQLKVEPATILILDEKLHAIPWEGLKIFEKISVTRMPAIEFVFQQAERLDSPKKTINRQRVRYVLNPAGDLKSTEKNLKPFLHKSELEWNWEGLTNEPPTSTQLRY